MLLKNIKNVIRRIIDKPIEPRKAYDMWAEIYDSGDDNLVFKMEEEIFNDLVGGLNLSGKVILDYGCGNGRNLKRLTSYKAAKIIACDISPKMLEQLKIKYPGFETHLIKSNSMLPFEHGTIDFILSTLVAAHIKDLRKVFSNWNNLLKPEGIIFISDLHPAILSAGGKRTFEKNGKTYQIKNYIHSVENIKKHLGLLNLEVIGFKESYISKSSIDFYQKKNALHIYERYYGQPLVYGMLIRRKK